MKQTSPFSLKKRLQSFQHAWNGLRILWREEPNARIHFVAAMVAFSGAWWLHISAMEWVCIVLCVGMVFSLELVNSALENLADHVTAEQHPTIKRVKDLAAAAVLVAAIVAVVVAVVIFGPKLWGYFA